MPTLPRFPRLLVLRAKMFSARDFVRVLRTHRAITRAGLLRSNLPIAECHCFAAADSAVPITRAIATRNDVSATLKFDLLAHSNCLTDRARKERDRSRSTTQTFAE